MVGITYEYNGFRKKVQIFFWQSLKQITIGRVVLAILQTRVEIWDFSFLTFNLSIDKKKKLIDTYRILI